MKRFMFSCIGVSLVLLAVSMTQANSSTLVYRLGYNDKLLIILPGGEGYYQEFAYGDHFAGAAHACGNFWGSLQEPEGVQYIVVSWSGGLADRIFAVSPSGETFAQWITGDDNRFLAEPVHIGNFWTGNVSTDKSTWSGVKGQFKK